MTKLLKDTLENLSQEIPIDTIKEVQEFIKNNKDSIIIINFTKELIKIYESIFYDPNLQKALNIPSNLRYQRIQEIYRYLPIRDKVFLYQNFYKFLEIPSEYYGSFHNFYRGCKWLFQKYGLSSNIQLILNELVQFTKDNKTTISGGIDTYDTLEIEFQRYRNAINGYTNDPDFRNFAFRERVSNMSTDYEILQKYINKKLGTLGELYAFELIKKQINATFTAKELGNGFGYDMYYQSGNSDNITENLIEVKTTANLNDDYFTLSENEYKIMLETESNPHANYLIYRYIYDINNNSIWYYILKYENGILKSLNYDEDKIEYIPNPNNKKLFERKQDILKLTNKKEG